MKIPIFRTRCIIFAGIKSWNYFRGKRPICFIKLGPILNMSFNRLFPFSNGQPLIPTVLRTYRNFIRYAAVCLKLALNILQTLLPLGGVLKISVRDMGPVSIINGHRLLLIDSIISSWPN